MAQKRPARFFIVPQCEVMGEEAIKAEVWRLQDFSSTDPLESMQWLARRRCLKNERSCEECHIMMSLVKRCDRQDKWIWKCRICKKNVSVRNDSFFARSHLSFQQLIIVIYCWSMDYPQNLIIHEARLSPSTKHTLMDWSCFCRDICEAELETIPMFIGGLNEDGTSKVVEIDLKFFDRKNHQVQRKPGHWVFGGTERGSGMCFLVELDNKRKERIRDEIERHILPGTVIMSDGWASYVNINGFQGGIYEHVIANSEHFVDPNNREIHIQNVGNMWMRAKMKLRRQFGTSQELFATYLNEFVWKNRHKDTNIFSQFLCGISHVYTLSSMKLNKKLLLNLNVMAIYAYVIKRLEGTKPLKPRLRRKINFPSADRNKAPILEVLKKYFDNSKEGKVLEISSGTGQHAAHFARHFPKLTFYTSEFEESLMDSIRAYAADTPTKNVKEPVFINVVDDWTRWNVPNDFDYAVNINMIHVTPLSCSIGLFKNVSGVLKTGGFLITYGAYANNGVLEPQSNKDFDKSIRQRDPNCGIRDIQDLKKISETYGIELKSIEEMPSNNKCLIWQKTKAA